MRAGCTRLVIRCPNPHQSGYISCVYPHVALVSGIRASASTIHSDDGRPVMSHHDSRHAGGAECVRAVQGWLFDAQTLIIYDIPHIYIPMWHWYAASEHRCRLSTMLMNYIYVDGYVMDIQVGRYVECACMRESCTIELV
jgi:hypothetical protein